MSRIRRRFVARYVRRWHSECHRQRRAWRKSDPTDSRVDLWLSRAEGASAMLRWLGEEQG